MKPKSRTDREETISSNEFVWDSKGLSECHNYLAASILKQLGNHPARTVLDLGCGNGSFTALVAKNGYEVAGLDHSISGIELAKKQFPNVQFEQHDISQFLPQEHVGKYDALVSLEVIEHLLLPRKLMENALIALRPGGLLILSTPYHGYWKNLALALTNKFDAHWHPLRDFGHIKFFSKATIMQLFIEFGFEHIKFKAAGRIPPLASSMIISANKPKSFRC